MSSPLHGLLTWDTSACSRLECSRSAVNALCWPPAACAGAASDVGAGARPAGARAWPTWSSDTTAERSTGFNRLMSCPAGAAGDIRAGARAAGGALAHVGQRTARARSPAVRHPVRGRKLWKRIVEKLRWLVGASVASARSAAVRHPVRGMCSTLSK